MSTKGNENASKAITSVAQASTAKLNKATEGLVKIIEDLKKSNDVYDELVQSVQIKQAELEKLETEFAEKERQMKADLALRAKESEISLVSEVLSKQNKTSIDVSELNSLRKELETIKANFADSVKAETGKQVGILSSRHESEIKQKELEFEAKTATMKASLDTAKDKNDALIKQVEDYKSQIEADRNARIEEAKARGGQAIYVTGDKK